MLATFLNKRKLVVLFLIVSFVMLAGQYGKVIYDPSRRLHEEGAFQYPRSDCGDNFFLFLRLPGDHCMERGDSAEKVEKAMEEIDPNIWKRPFEETNASWDQILYHALRDILKWNIP